MGFCKVFSYKFDKKLKVYYFKKAMSCNLNHHYHTNKALVGEICRVLV